LLMRALGNADREMGRVARRHHPPLRRFPHRNPALERATTAASRRSSTAAVSPAEPSCRSPLENGCEGYLWAAIWRITTTSP
jgi:hypothetical protein